MKKICDANNNYVCYNHTSRDEYSKVISIVWLSFVVFNKLFVFLVFNENVTICTDNMYNINSIPNEITGEHNIGNMIPVYRLESKQTHNENIAET